MMKRFFRNLSKSFCIYLLVILNILHAIQIQSYDWLLWASIILAGLSLLLNAISAWKEEPPNAQT